MKPLSGIRVVELARILAGPWAGQALADLGAEVIKIERAGVGDDTRQWGPPFVTAEDGASLDAAYFHSANRGKTSVAVDFSTEEGQARIRDLVTGADVLIENFKVGGLKRYGLDYDSLSTLNPRLVYCSITGFGQDGPYAGRAGYDYMIQAMGGIMDITGEPDGPPIKPGVAFADIFTGVYSALAVVSALRLRDRTGKGSHIDMALMDTQVSVLANQAMNYLVTGVSPKRFGNGHPNLVPYQVFPVADGHLVIAVGNDGQFARLCALLGDPGLAESPDYLTNADRIAHREPLCGRISELTSAWTRDDLLAGLETAGVPAGPINSVADVFADPQVIHRGLQVSVESAGTAIPSVAGPIVIDGERMVAAKASPRLGEDG